MILNVPSEEESADVFAFDACSDSPISSLLSSLLSSHLSVFPSFLFRSVNNRVKLQAYCDTPLYNLCRV